MIALTHRPSPNLAACELTHLARAPIDFASALRQHDAYCQMLRDCGAEVQRLDVNDEMPDAVFVEDTAIVLDEVAVLASMGSESRRAEPAGIIPALRPYREIRRIELPATIEGGDVLRIGRKLLVGISSRTNYAGLGALAGIVSSFGYEIIPVRIAGCLHLKTACTALPDGTLLLNPAWLKGGQLDEFKQVHVHRHEPWAANVALVNGTVCLAAEHPHTREQVEKMGFKVRATPLSEFARAEGGVTCLSILLDQTKP